MTGPRTDAETLPAYADVVGYLEAQGWRPRGYWHTGRIWTIGEFDVLVPPADSVPDYPARIRDLVRCVADAEQREPDVVRRDIAAIGVDVVGYRIGAAGGHVSLGTGAAALRALWLLVAGCASQVVAAEVAVPARQGGAVSDLLDDVVMAPRRQEFGVDLHLPGPGSRLGRSVGVQLLDVSSAIWEAAGRRDAAEPELLAESGIRWETLATFGALGQATRSPTAFALEFRWSRQVPRADVVVAFPAEAVARLPRLTELAAAAGRRRAAPEEPTPEAPVVGMPATVEGTVVTVGGDRGFTMVVRGRMAVADAVSARIRRITVHLRSAEELDIAWGALRSGATVRAVGTVGRRRDLQVSEDGLSVLEVDGP